MRTLPKAPGVSTDQYTLKWDAWNRLVEVKDGSTVVASYTYDGLNRRLTKTAGSEIRHYYYDTQWRPLEERVGSSTTPDRQYTWGVRDRWDLLRRKRSTTGTLDETLYVLRDYLDPVAIADAAGNVVERYAYDAFGNVRFLDPNYGSRSNSSYAWDFLFHGEFRDPETKLYNYGHRYYDTGLGRWLSRDPIGERGGVNLYSFVENRPANTIDQHGTLSLTFDLNSQTPIETMSEKMLRMARERRGPDSPDYWRALVEIQSAIDAYLAIQAIYRRNPDYRGVQEWFADCDHLSYGPHDRSTVIRGPKYNGEDRTIKFLDIPIGANLERLGMNYTFAAIGDQARGEAGKTNPPDPIDVSFHTNKGPQHSWGIPFPGKEYVVPVPARVNQGATSSSNALANGLGLAGALLEESGSSHYYNIRRVSFVGDGSCRWVLRVQDEGAQRTLSASEATSLLRRWYGSLGLPIPKGL